MTEVMTIGATRYPLQFGHLPLCVETNAAAGHHLGPGFLITSSPAVLHPLLLANPASPAAAHTGLAVWLPCWAAIIPTDLGAVASMVMGEETQDDSEEA